MKKTDRLETVLFEKVGFKRGFDAKQTEQTHSTSSSSSGGHGEGGGEGGGRGGEHTQNNIPDRKPRRQQNGTLFLPVPFLSTKKIVSDFPIHNLI